MKHGTTRDTRRTKCGGRSFICITDREDEALPLGRVNGARFKAMIKKELKGNKYVHKNPEARRKLSRPTHNHVVTLLNLQQLRHNNFSLRRNHCRTMAGVDVDTLTIEQYLALSRENQAPGVVKPEIRGNVNFEIKSQFMRELREDTFSRNKYEDAHDHIDRVLSIVGLFNILGVSKDVVML
ncbi:hypothetical protein Tco_0582760 [Tanacetum coccineum]